MIRLNNVSFRATNRMVLENLNLEIEPGECVCITGKSGCGKSLVLSMLRGDGKPTSGSVTVDQVDINKLSAPLLQLYRRNLGIMLQEDQLLRDRSIAANIAMGLVAQNAPTEELALRTTTLLHSIGLVEKASQFPDALHHGERRRVTLAQAIAHNPSIVLIDEPISGLDTESSTIILRLLQQANANGATLIIATHNPEDCSSLAPRMINVESKKEPVAISPIMG